MKNMKRSKRSAIIAGGLAAIAAIGGAFAFLSDSDNAVNKFSFADENDNQSVDIEMKEPNWVESHGKNIKYGTPIAKNPIVQNISTSDNAQDVYAFATVILPAKSVAVQDVYGALINPDGSEVTGVVTLRTDGNYYESATTDVALNPAVTADAAKINAAKYVRKLVNNVSKNDIDAENDETDILGVYTNSDLADAHLLKWGDDIPATVYFKLDSTSPYGSAVAGTNYKLLTDTVDGKTGVTNILGHQFIWSYSVKLNEGVPQAEIRELYTLERKANGSFVRTDNINDKTNNIGSAWAARTFLDENEDEKFCYYRHNSDEAAGTVAGINGTTTDTNANVPEESHWIEITDEVYNNGNGDAVIYVDNDGRVYSAHVFYYSTPLAKGEETVPLFDGVELINISDNQIDADDDLNIYVNSYAVQTDGIGDAVPANATAKAEGKAIWDVMTNSVDQGSFDIFSVVKNANSEYKTFQDIVETTTANSNP